VDVRHLPAKGRGRALAAAWSASDAPVLAARHQAQGLVVFALGWR
jgi:hypothetical protein